MTPKNIVHLTNVFKFDGTGHTISTLDLALGQREHGDTVTVSCSVSDQRMRELLSDRGIRLLEGVHMIGLKQGGRSVSYSELRGVLHAADVLHFHTAKSMVAALACDPWSYLRKSVTTIHNPHQRSVANVMLLSKVVVSLSHADAEHVSRQTHGLVKPLVIQNGSVGSYRFLMRGADEEPDLGPDAILFIGALNERKGIDVLIRSMRYVIRTVPTAHLYVMGNKDNPAILGLPESCGIADFVTFLGFKDNPIPYLKVASLFVLPSREEGFGNVLTEARICGVPIIASKVGGIPEALDGGEAGCLVPPEDERGLAEAIIAVLTDGQLAEDLRARSSASLERLSVAHFVDEYDRAYERL